jgi:hypothetical protein
VRIDQEVMPIGLLQGGASEHRLRIVGETSAHEGAEPFKPWLAVSVI